MRIERIELRVLRLPLVPNLIDPPIAVRADGIIPVPPGPGTGVRVVGDRVDAATLRREECIA